MRIYLKDSDKQYASLFSNGLLFPKMIFCITDSCKPLYDYDDTIINDTSKYTIAKYGDPYMVEYETIDDTIHLCDYSKELLLAMLSKNSKNVRYKYIVPSRYDRYGWKGVSVIIRHIKELDYLEKSGHQRVFKFEIAMSEGCCNPTDYRYFIEVENQNSDRKSKLNDFIKNAQVRFFYFTGRSFEI